MKSSLFAKHSEKESLQWKKENLHNYMKKTQPHDDEVYRAVNFFMCCVEIKK